MIKVLVLAGAMTSSLVMALQDEGFDVHEVNHIEFNNSMLRRNFEPLEVLAESCYQAVEDESLPIPILKIGVPCGDNPHSIQSEIRDSVDMGSHPLRM